MNYKILIVFLFHSTFLFHGCGILKKKKAPSSKPYDIKQEVNIPEDVVLDTLFEILNKDTIKQNIQSVDIDSFQNAIAQLISAKDKSYFDKQLNLDNNLWNDFSEDVNKDFNKIKVERLDNMDSWVSSDFLGPSMDTLLLFYPFSGPDFLHAYHLYPNANDYVLLALEEVGYIPDLETMGPSSTQRYLKNINIFLRDIYLRSYFITKHMTSDINDQNIVSGVLPSLYWFLARTDHQIVKLERISLDKNGKIIIQDSNQQLDGVRITFTDNKMTDLKTLTYFCCDISNDGFRKKNPELYIYLKNMRACNTFVKSASYLMHYNSFQNIREIVTSKSKSIFQDDTGVPYKYFNHEEWGMRYFGSYVKPIKDFESVMNIVYQEDLLKVYNSVYKEKLPFSLGYHWRDASDQNQMLLIKTR